MSFPLASVSIRKTNPPPPDGGNLKINLLLLLLYVRAPGMHEVGRPNPLLCHVIPSQQVRTYVVYFEGEKQINVLNFYELMKKMALYRRLW